MTRDPDCLFCRVAAGEVDAETVRETERVVAFRDVNPQAPTHVLVIPRTHHPDVGSLGQAEPEALAEVVTACAEIASVEGVADSGYRIVFNTGSEAGQSVFHCHAHLLAGRPMGWPPG